MSVRTKMKLVSITPEFVGSLARFEAPTDPQDEQYSQVMHVSVHINSVPTMFQIGAEYYVGIERAE